MRYGFIGCGNMGGAIAKAVCAAKGPEHVLLANKTTEKAIRLAADLGCSWGSNEDAAKCKFVFLGVKPHMMKEVLELLQDVLASRKDEFVLVSMAAGLTISVIQEMAGGNYPVIRIMPNTPVSVGEGMIQYALRNVSREMEQEFLEAMSKGGKLDPLKEDLIDAASAVSGCGPAWTYMFLEALADGGVAAGLPRAKALEYAAQMLVGSGRLFLNEQKHPGELKDAVCSPGGSTIQGVRTLEQHGFRGAVMEAVLAAWEKNKQLGK